jgi:hypothetical protein
MSHYIKAEPGTDHTIIYTDESGRYFRFSGGTWAWRNHNPGNLVPGHVSARHNEIGSSGKFAIFLDYENGHLALLDCLQTTYKNASIDDLVEVYAPAKDGNNIKIYKKFLHEQTGVFDNKKVCDFTSEEFDKLWTAIEKIEGYTEGTIIEVFQIIQVHKDKQGMCEFNVKARGWLSKEECLRLAKVGRLDLIICISAMGHSYLRARPHSSINGSLKRLVVKKPKSNK